MEQLKKERRRLVFAIICMIGSLMLCSYVYKTGKLPIYGSVTEREYEALKEEPLNKNAISQIEARKRVINARDKMFAEYGY